MLNNKSPLELYLSRTANAVCTNLIRPAMISIFSG
jgi:hypothetical protein